MSDNATKEPAATVLNRSVDRACMIMSEFSLDESRLSLADLTRRTALPKPTVYRIAASLIARGFMTQCDDGRYALGSRFLEFGAVVRENLDMVQLCAPVIDALAASTTETILLASVDWAAAEVLLISRRDSGHALSVLSPIGRRQPIPAGAIGKALLMGLETAEAEAVLQRLRLVASTSNTHVDHRLLLEEIEASRSRGYVGEVDEYIDGVSGVAVPVVFDGGRPTAALAVVGPSSRLAAHLDETGEVLVRLSSSLRPVRS